MSTVTHTQVVSSYKLHNYTTTQRDQPASNHRQQPFPAEGKATRSHPCQHYHHATVREPTTMQHNTINKLR